MADLTITVAVTTGTQYITGSTSNIFTFDGSQPASFTFPWVQGGTVRLEQSGSSNDGHPLIFSTSNSETLGTMQAGIISSGVTYYLDGSSNQSDYTNTTTFNAATTRYIEIAPASQTDFYFACWVHGIGMGGIVDLTQNTWGALSWNDGAWNEQNDLTVSLTGLSATSSVGTPTASFYPGWGTLTWGQNGWGTITEATIKLSGLSATSSVGAITPADVMGLTGLSATSSVGGPSVKSDNTTVPAGQSVTSSVGSFVIETAYTLTGLSATSSVGTPTARSYHTITLTGLSATSSLGSVVISSAPLIQPSGVSATSSVGALSPADVMGLTGLSATSTVGSVSFTINVTVTPEGQTATATLNANNQTGPFIIHYADVDTGSNTTYTDVTGTERAA